MRRNYLPILAIIVACFIGGTAQQAAAQQKMSYGKYQAELARWQHREQDALKEIEILEQEIGALRLEIAALDEKIAQAWQSIYDLLGVTAEEFQAFADELDAIGARIAELGEMNADELYRNRSEIDQLESRLDELAQHTLARFSQYARIIDHLYSQLEALRARLPVPKDKTYTVRRGDYLWKIAAMREHYSDPMKWMRIFSVNRDQIRDPDLIYPEQRFTIPLDIDWNTQYLVKPGDFLYGIAEALYNDPFQWRRLYEENRQVISNPNLVYPETILTLPGR